MSKRSSKRSSGNGSRLYRSSRSQASEVPRQFLDERPTSVHRPRGKGPGGSGDRQQEISSSLPLSGIERFVNQEQAPSRGIIRPLGYRTRAGRRFRPVALPEMSTPSTRKMHRSKPETALPSPHCHRVSSPEGRHRPGPPDYATGRQSDSQRSGYNIRNEGRLTNRGIGTKSVGFGVSKFRTRRIGGRPKECWLPSPAVPCTKSSIPLNKAKRARY